jgi:hypothetical protein
MGTLSFVRASGAHRPSRTFVAGLFDGIRLTAEQERRAQEIIAESITAQLTVTLRNGDGWVRLAEVQERRDRALRELLSSDTDRALFDSQSTELRRRHAEFQPTNPVVPVVLHAGIAPLLGGTLEVVFRADGMSDEEMETASWQIVHAFRGDAELLDVSRVTAIADILDRRDEFATYTRSVKRTFGRQADGAWVPLPAP